jgi:hypothetical protein
MKIYVTIGMIFVLGIIAAVWTSFNVNPEKTDIVAEIFKSSLQLVAVAVLGGFVAALYKEAQERQAAQQRELEGRQAAQQKEAEARQAAQRQLDETRKDFLRKFRGVYFDVKKTRRLLSVAGLTDKFKRAPTILSDAQLESYRENMRTLNELQLRLEDLNSEVDICLCHYMHTGEISKDLRRMERYLRSIIKEFERFGGIELPDGQRIKFESLAELRIFTGHAKKKIRQGDETEEGSFNANMSMPYWSVVKAIYAELSVNATLGKHQPR